MEQCKIMWWNSRTVWKSVVEQEGGTVEQCGRTVWWNSGTVEQCGGTMEQCGRTV